MLRGFAIGFVVALVAACATLKNDRSVCAEYRDLRCAAGTSCTMDRSRGCRVCHCDSIAGGVGPDGNPTVNSPPPDQR